MRFPVLLFCTIMITSCSPSPDQVPKIAESQLEALEKAKAVDAALQQTEKNKAKQLDDENPE